MVLSIRRKDSIDSSNSLFHGKIGFSSFFGSEGDVHFGLGGSFGVLFYSLCCAMNLLH